MPEIINTSSEILEDPLARDFIEAVTSAEMPWANATSDKFDELGDPVPRPGLLFLGLGSVGLSARFIRAENSIRIRRRPEDLEDKMTFGDPTGLYPVVCEAASSGVFSFDPSSIVAIYQGTAAFLSLMRKYRAHGEVRHTSETLLTSLTQNTRLFGVEEDSDEAQRQAAIVRELVDTTRGDLPRRLAEVEVNLMGLGVAYIDNKPDHRDGSWPLPTMITREFLAAA